MTTDEIVRALRAHLERYNCNSCPQTARNGCTERLCTEAVSLIERLTAENAALRKEIEWKGMVISLAQRKQAEAEAERDALLARMKKYRSCYDCKHGEQCEFDDANVIDCMNCVKKNCPCAQCCDSSHWEWRGLPEAPEEGEKV